MNARRWTQARTPDGYPRWAYVEGDNPATMTVLAIATMTGSRADNYPWDWYIWDQNASGVADTLRSAKAKVEAWYRG